MAAQNGRDFTIDWDSTTLVGVQSKAVTLANELVDVTSDDDEGWRTYLSEAGVKSIEVKVDMISSDDVLITEFFNASVTGETLAGTIPLTSSTTVGFTGTFLLQDLEPKGERDGAVELSATFVSSGAISATSSGGA